MISTVSHGFAAMRMLEGRKCGPSTQGRLCAAAAALILSSPALGQPVSAQPGHSAPAETSPSTHGRTLSLNEAIALANDDQPTIAAFEREAAASEEAAIAARSLPDPELMVGVRDFPVTGENAFSPTADNFTMYMIGLTREQVRRSRREAESARLRAEALVSRAEATAQERRIQRDVMLAWINAVEASAKQRLLDRLIGDLTAGYQVMEAGIPTGASTPALALQARAEIALAESERAGARGQAARARAELSRWIGPAALRPLPNEIPALQVPATATSRSLLVSEHPHVLLAEAQQQAAQRQIDVARSERKPSLTWSVTYGFRPEFGDLVTAQVSIPLQINRRGLQNRRTAEASARADAARLRVDDARRELCGAHAAALADYEGAEAQLSIINDQALPAFEASFESAEARYAAGQGTLELPFNVVQQYVRTHLQSLDQQARRARAAAELIYLSGTPR